MDRRERVMGEKNRGRRRVRVGACGGDRGKGKRGGGGEGRVGKGGGLVRVSSSAGSKTRCC